MVAVQTFTAVAASRLPQSTSRRWAFLRLGIVWLGIVWTGLLGGCAARRLASFIISPVRFPLAEVTLTLHQPNNNFDNDDPIYLFIFAVRG